MSLAATGASFESILDQMGTLAFTNVGVSMMPLIRQGRDVMVIRRKGEEPCKRLDAILFRRPGKEGRGSYVLHRVLRVNRDGTYWVVGDNCWGGETVRDEHVLGVLYALVRDGRELRMDSVRQRAYAHLWCDLWPARFALLRGKSIAGRVVRKALRAKGG